MEQDKGQCHCKGKQAENDACGSRFMKDTLTWIVGDTHEPALPRAVAGSHSQTRADALYCLLTQAVRSLVAPKNKCLLRSRLFFFRAYHIIPCQL